MEALLTGALHEDAVADFFDAFGGGKTREDVLRILKDSRIGSFGLVGLGLLLALRVAALIAIENLAHVMLALVISSALGRLAMLITMVGTPPALQGIGIVGNLSEKLTWREVIQASALISPLLIYTIWTNPVAFMIILVFGTGLISWFIRFLNIRIGGSTGDCIGTVGYMFLVLTTLAFSAKI